MAASKLVAITGGMGFIGAHLAKRLAMLDYRVRVIDIVTPSHEARPRLDGVEYYLGYDLRDVELAKDAFSGVEICVALAARSAGIADFNRRPADFLRENLQITTATFEACKLNGVDLLVYASSSCVYDRLGDQIIIDQSPLEILPPAAGYPFSKFAGELLAHAYRTQYDLSSTIVRPFNVYGPGEFPGSRPGLSHVIPDLTHKLILEGNPVAIFGDGYQTRSFTHVEDVVEGIRLCIEKPEARNREFNLGYPGEISIRDLASLVWRLLGHDTELQFRELSSFPVDVRRRSVQLGRATSLLGWIPRVPLDEGLKEYIEWYSECASKEVSGDASNQ